MSRITQKDKYTEWLGSFFDEIKSAIGWVSSKLPLVKQIAQSIDHSIAQTGANVLSARGYGKKVINWSIV